MHQITDMEGNATVLFLEKLTKQGQYNTNRLLHNRITQFSVTMEVGKRICRIQKKMYLSVS